MLALLALGFAGGGYVGQKYGRHVEKGVWMDTMITWGCAGHEAKTGEIVFTGGACNPTILDPLEPVEFARAEEPVTPAKRRK
jgi:hypothetical protein